MKANELRVLNYVLDIGDKLCQVMRVHANGVVGLSAIDGSYQWESFNLEDNVNPIPLTEEWLARFGFEKPAHSWNGKIFHLSEWDNYPLNWLVAMDKNGAVLVSRLKYVHQLQNLYFALTGEELKEVTMAKQTAVEWLIEQLDRKFSFEDVLGSEDKIDYYNTIEQSKEIEKEQIVNCCFETTQDCWSSMMEYLGQEIIFSDKDIKQQKLEAEKYYNETYKGGK